MYRPGLPALPVSAVRGGVTMTYDDWKASDPRDRQERIEQRQRDREDAAERKNQRKRDEGRR